MKADNFNPEWATAEPTTAAAPAVVEWHGGPDALGVPRWDFSTNANACGPSPALMQALASVDRCHYPDPAYTALRKQLADLHGVVPERIVLAASASEFIGRMTTVVALARPGARVLLPLPGYGDYVRSAIAHDLEPITALDLLAEAQSSAQEDEVPDAADFEGDFDDEDDDEWGIEPDEDDPFPAAASDAPVTDWSRVQAPALVWHTEPGSPMGQADGLGLYWPGAVTVIDRAYSPLQLDGLAHPCPDDAWQLWSPNKALGVTGVRGAYAVAPASALGRPDLAQALSPASVLQRLNALQPSWPLGGDGVALLSCWSRPETLVWVHGCLDTLRQWKASQWALYAELGWQVHPSTTAYGVVTWPQVPGREMHRVLPALRRLGLKLRDTTSMGLPGWVRLSVQSPAAQQALREAWYAVTGAHRPSGLVAPLSVPEPVAPPPVPMGWVPAPATPPVAAWPQGAAMPPGATPWPVWPGSPFVPGHPMVPAHPGGLDPLTGAAPALHPAMVAAMAAGWMPPQR